MSQTAEAPPTVGQSETDARIDLAAAHRMANLDGLNEASWNHFSLSVPGTTDQVLISPGDTHWSQVNAGNLVLVGPDPEPVRAVGSTLWVGYCIHYTIHMARPDAAAVLHAHSPYASALGMIEDNELVMAHQHATIFHNQIAYNEVFDGGVMTIEKGKEIVELLGDKKVLFMRNHGVIVVGDTLAGAYTDLLCLELACRNQILAMSTGSKLVPVPDEELAERGWTGTKPRDIHHFAAMKRVLDKTQPDYKDF